MTTPNEWTPVTDHAWELHGLGAQYTAHEENDHWVVRRFSLSSSGDATKQDEQQARSLEHAKELVQQWESQ